jgi:hypothetical protein
MATERARQKAVRKQGTSIEMPILTLKVNGPGVRRGRIPVPDLVRICQEAQNAVKRQAEAIEGRNTRHPGPTSNLILQECTLELIAIRKGSTALDFAMAKPQMVLPFEEMRHFGSEVVEELADTIKSLGNGNRKSNIDPGVLESIYSLSSLIETGRITELEWIAPKPGRKKVSGFVNRKVREHAATQLSGPRFKITQVDGILDMADFSRRERKCRIDPAIGLSVVCTFSPEHENTIQALLRQPVRVIGLGRIQPQSDRIDSIEIQRIEILPSLSLGEGNFFLSPSIEQLAASQGVGPLRDTSKLGGVLEDNEVEEFISEIYSSREIP